MINWKSREESGIYAIAEIIEPPKIIALPPDIGYWIDTSRVGVKPCARIRFTSKLLDKPLLRENLKQDPVLKNLIVIRSSECYQLQDYSAGMVAFVWVKGIKPFVLINIY